MMKQLKKPTTAKNCPHQERFDKTCTIIRKALKIDHWRHSYILDAREDEENEDAAATYWHYDEGEYIAIYVRPGFWNDEDAEWQFRALIHEHVHAVLSPCVQAYNKISDRMHESDTSMAKTLYGHANERVTCHLEAVLYDLIRGELETV